MSFTGGSATMHPVSRRASDTVKSASLWFRRLNTGQKALCGFAAGMLALLCLYVIIEDHDVLFIISEACHLVGIAILLFKLHQKNSASGLSLRTQRLTALFLAVRLYCSSIMEQDIHTFLDFLTLGATAWIIFMMMTKTKDTWQADKDSLHELYVVVPCAVLAMLSHPRTRHVLANRILWAFCVYVEAVSVAPQVAMLQNNRTIEKFTGHYVFFLGLARFFSCAHWLLQMADSSNQVWAALGSGVWPVMVLVSEIVQTAILADFCYYYVKSLSAGLDTVQLPTSIV